MKIIVRPRQGGKTTELVKMAHKHNGYIVCLNHLEVARVFEESQHMECKINFPITFHEFLNHEYNDKGVKKFYIDNVEMLIQQLTNVPIEAITLTGEML